MLNNNINTGKKGSNAIIWNASSFGLPSVGADLLSNPAVAKRNMLTGPGAWGVNLGIHKAFPFGERVVATLGADFDNIFNHPLLAPDANFGGGGGTFAELGDFVINVDPNTGVVLPIANRGGVCAPCGSIASTTSTPISSNARGRATTRDCAGSSTA